MKLIILSTILAVLFSAFSVDMADADNSAVSFLRNKNQPERKLLQNWIMNEYNSYADDGVFTVRFEYAFGEPVFEVFETCPHGDNSVPNIGTAPDGAFFMKNQTYATETTTDPVTPNSAKWSFAIDESIATYSGYSESNNTGSASFCIRFGIADIDAGGAIGPLVNFREAIMTINYDLLIGFETLEIATQAYEPATADYTQTFSTSVFTCGDFSYNSPVKPGDEICIQVCPSGNDADSIYLDGIESMSVKLISDPAITQGVVAGGSLVNENLAEMECGYCCTISFVLHAVFFPLADPDTDYVKVEGTVTANLLGGISRRLASNAGTDEEESHSNFEATLAVSGASNNDHSAATALIYQPKGIMLLALLGGAILL